MTFSQNNKISLRQLQILLVLDMLGTGVITLPAKVGAHAGTDGWISVAAATAVTALAAFLITTLASRFPDKSFPEYSSELLTRPVGIIVSLGFAVKLILLSAFELRLFGEILRQTLLHNTPFAAVCTTMLCLSAYAAAKGYETRARLAEILIFIALVPVLIVFLMAAVQVDYSNLLPLFRSSPESVLCGGYSALYSFTGIEFCLLAAPYLNKPQKMRRPVIHVVIIVGIFMTAVTALTIARFGVEGVTRRLWPVLEMMDTVDLPGSFIERQNAIVMSFWIISVFAITNAALFFSSLLLKDITRGRVSHSKFILICIPIIFALSFLPDDAKKTMEYITYVNNSFGAAYIFILPLIMLAVAKIRGKGRKA